MTSRTLAAELSSHIGKEVHIRGWLNNFRPLGKINFLILRDRSGFAQVVIENKEDYQQIADPATWLHSFDPWQSDRLFPGRTRCRSNPS